MKRKLAIVDFETESIESRPDYPPKPVGVAIYRVPEKPVYMAWGHPTENNCTWAQAKEVLKKVYRECEVVFHNSVFDIEVGDVHMGLPQPAVFHDTLFLAFLHDPRDESLSLKPLAHKYLNMPPDEQDELCNWILEWVDGSTEKNWGGFISKAPGKLVGRYAIGDVVRTYKLFKLFYDYVVRTGMIAAYNREIKLVRPVRHMEAVGVALDVKRLKKDVLHWKKRIEELSKGVYKSLGQTFDIDSNQQLADALDRADKVSGWIYTEPTKSHPNGQKSTSRKNLEKVCTDQKLMGMLNLRGVLNTYVNTFALPWLEKAELTGGRLYPRFHQVRSTDEYNGGGKGTRTGRFSSSDPNFQNVPADPAEMHKDKDWAKELPFLRDYIIPDEGCAFIGRDYNQQEIRILAHYEDGEFLRRYIENPTVDAHELARQLIHERTGILYPRKFIKVTAFGIIYGMGLDKLMGQLEVTRDDAAAIRKAYLSTIPGIKTLMNELKDIGQRKEAIRTWGGRIYYCEKPKIIKGRLWTFEYKLLNLLIQGGAADCTKQAMVNINDLWGISDSPRIAIQVHDELLACCPVGKEKKYMKQMQECMEGVEFDLPMLSDGKMSKISWGAMEKFVV
jgi:DNA polymerase-1